MLGQWAKKKLHMRKSKPVLVAAGIIWILIGAVYTQQGMQDAAETAFRHTLLEFAELMLFLLVAMTYINALEERRLFDALRAWMIRKGFSYRSLFWITAPPPPRGSLLLNFPYRRQLNHRITDVPPVVMKVAEGETNALLPFAVCQHCRLPPTRGALLAPFGDITTLMVWQAGMVSAQEFLVLARSVGCQLPRADNYHELLYRNRKPSAQNEDVELKRGAFRIMTLFFADYCDRSRLPHPTPTLPPVLALMMGLGYLQFFGIFLRMTLPGLAGTQTTMGRAGWRSRTSENASVVWCHSMFFQPSCPRRVGHSPVLLCVVMCVGAWFPWLFGTHV